MWVEINGKVNYPIKSALIGMQQRGEIDWTHQLTNLHLMVHTMSGICWLCSRCPSRNNHPVPGTL